MPIQTGNRTRYNQNRLPLPNSPAPRLRGFCVYLPDDAEWLSYMLGAIGRLARQSSWQRQDGRLSSDVAGVWLGVYNRLASDGFVACSDCALPDGISINQNGDVEICGMGDIIINNCGCGCGGSTGSTGATGSTGVGDSIVTFPSSDSVPVDCYAAKAVDYLLERAKEYQKLMADIAITGFDNLLGPADEAVDLAALAVGLLTGDVDSNSYREFTSIAIDAAFNDAAFRATMVSEWLRLGYVGEVTRDQLRTWAAKAPILVRGIPMRSWLGQWLSTSVIPFYNQSLARFATECATGNTLVSSGTLSDFFTIGAETYALLLGTQKTVALGVPYELTIPTGYEAVAWFWSMSNEVSDCPVTPSPTFQFNFGDEVRESNGQGYSEPSTYYFMRLDSTSPTLAEIQSAFPGVASPGEIGAFQPEPGAFGGAFELAVTDAGQWCDGYTIDYVVNLLVRASGAGGGG